MELLKKYNKLKASSLIESVIAMTIISVCVLIAMSVYAMVLKSSKSITYYQLQTERQKILNEIKNNTSLTNETYDFKKFSIEKVIQIHESNAELLELSLTTIHKKDTLTYVYLIQANENN